MEPLDLFPRDQIVGVFRGFREGGLEFHADLVLPYRNEFQSTPMHGQFLLVQLETPDEAVLGRIASFSSEGKLSFGSGEEFTIRAVQESRPVPEDLRKQYLKYRVNIRVLGVLRRNPDETLTFVASHRRLPHVGSPVAFPTGRVLQEIAGHSQVGAVIGHFALGEYIYAQGSKGLQLQDWMQVKGPEVMVRFPVESLVSRRSFILARAGFGKSNLNKLLFSELYQVTPTVEKRGGKQVPVGTVVFDPDGEYFWPDDKGRPGLCDVPHLRDQVVVFTSRRAPSDFYQSFVAGGIRLDLRLLKASDVISIALPPERQDQQNVRKLAGLDAGRWRRLVNLIHEYGNQAPPHEVADLLDLDSARQEAELLAARANMTTIVRLLHQPNSQLMDMLLGALAEGKLCVVDVSQMRGSQALMLSGLILRRIFDNNQEQFTAREPRTIPTIAVVEEAQSVLNERAAAAEPYIAWVKEGRKYDLGALLITQQPGSIPTEILSQGDNWFIFHLLSASDLSNVQRANAHFSEDLLSALLNEPIPGQGVFWSSVGEKPKPYPVPVRILLFESLYQALDPAYDAPAVATFATTLREKFDRAREELLMAALEDAPPASGPEDPGLLPASEEVDTADVYEVCKQRAVRDIRADATLMRQLRSEEGVMWGVLLGRIQRSVPSVYHDANGMASRLVPEVLTELFGRQDIGWHSFKNASHKTCVRMGEGQGNGRR